VSDLVRTLHDFAALFDRLEVPEQFMAGRVDTVAGMPLVKFWLDIIDRGIDVDMFLAESGYQQALMRRWTKELGVAERLEEVLASRP
jgi:hypothetical protein